jgi:hypothetical protein
MQHRRAAEAELSIRKLELSVKARANDQLMSQLKYKNRDLEDQNKELESLRKLPQEIKELNSEWRRLREEDSSHYARMAEGYLTEQSQSRLRIIDMESKLKLQQDQLVEKDKEVSSWKRKPAEATKAQNDAIGSRYEAIEAKEVVSKQFQGLQED